MSELYQTLWAGWQLDIGLTNAPKRFLFWTLGVGVLLYLVKPKSLFDKTGKMYPWKLISDESDGIYFDFYSASVLAGGILSMI